VGNSAGHKVVDGKAGRLDWEAPGKMN
jgi:hypothetical protein